MVRSVSNEKLLTCASYCYKAVTFKNSHMLIRAEGGGLGEGKTACYLTWWVGSGRGRERGR